MACPTCTGLRSAKLNLADPNRRGLLGQGSLLTVTSYPNRTSVVQRGKWILENLLGTPPPPPPPGAADGFSPHGSGGKLTLRQAMEQHRANPTCAVCHSRMDPIGFALENYNGIGKWRVMDDTGAKIDSSGTLPGGATFNGPAGLTQLLLTDKKNDFVDDVYPEADDVFAGPGSGSLRRTGDSLDYAGCAQGRLPHVLPDFGHCSQCSVSDEKDRGRLRETEGRTDQYAHEKSRSPAVHS